MEKFIYYNNLYLIYKNLIKENNQNIFDLYYGENLSMQEIASLKQISKSRVGIIIKNVEKKLNYYEDNLKVYELYTKLNNLLDLDNLEDVKKELEEILKG